jgi:RimJ/RimL family protein N-acetyltransferase
MLETERLLLRRWQEEDRQPFARMNSDPRVMEFMPALLSPGESDRLADRIEQHFVTHGFGLYAAQDKQGAQFMGFIGMSIPNFTAHFTPCVEVGWRLAAEFWGQGFATEGAAAVVDYAFESRNHDHKVGVTKPANIPTGPDKEKNGMTYSPSDDFDSPTLPEGHPGRRQVLYRLSKLEWTRVGPLRGRLLR